MAFLDWPQEALDRPRGADARRKRVAEELLGLFAAAYPQIQYSLMWDSGLLNAQAWRLGEARHVYVYGGLARHPKVTRPGLALAIAHETGHHLGGRPRDPFLTWMSWEGCADYWAASIGMPTVFGADADATTVQGARQIANLQRELAGTRNDPLPEFSPRQRSAVFRAGMMRAGLPNFALRILEAEQAEEGLLD